MTRDQFDIVLIAGGWAAAVGVAGLVLGWLLRRRSLRWQSAGVAVVAVGAVIAGTIATANAMFLSSHDFGVVLWVSGVAGVIALAVALGSGQVMIRGARSLQAGARRFGETGEYVASGEGPKEFRDVSAELARAAEMLRVMHERESMLTESRRELIAWVSHDLRTPLAGLRAMAESLEDGIAEDPARYHRQIRTEVDRMVRMVDDLFELSRINAGVLSLSIEPVDVGDLVSEALAGADALARSSGVVLSGRVDSGVVVAADASRLTRIVSNLMMNAIRHTPADGVVAISAVRRTDGVELSVTDSCGGIPEHDLDRVFDLAWRGSTARTPHGDDAHGSGAGLGLAIVKGFVEAHAGTVTVRNEGAGCRFAVWLPAGA